MCSSDLADTWRRVATSVAEAEKPELRAHWAAKFEAAMADLEFLPAGRIIVEIACGDRVIPVLDWRHPSAAPGKNQRGPSVRCVLPAGGDRFALRLRSEGAPERDSEYPMPFKRSHT